MVNAGLHLNTTHFKYRSALCIGSAVQNLRSGERGTGYTQLREVQLCGWYLGTKNQNLLAGVFHKTHQHMAHVPSPLKKEGALKLRSTESPHTQTSISSLILNHPLEHKLARV